MVQLCAQDDWEMWLFEHLGSPCHNLQGHPLPFTGLRDGQAVLALLFYKLRAAVHLAQGHIESGWE